MKKLIAISMVVLAGLTACDRNGGGSAASTGSKSSNGSTGVSIGVVDPTRVFRAMGWSDEVQKNVQAADNELRRQADAHLAPGRAAFEQKKKDIFAEAHLSADQVNTLNTKATTRAELEKMGLTAKQIDDLLQANNVWQADMRSANATVQQVANQRNSQIQASFNEVLAPAIRRVASANGRSAIFIPQQLAYFDPSLDLTDKLVDELQKTPGLKLNLPEMPRVDFPAAGQAGVSAPTTGPSGPSLLAPGSTTAPATQPH